LVTVSGTGTTLTSTINLEVARNGRGTLHILDGANVYANRVEIGSILGIGDITVAGPGSMLTCTFGLEFENFSTANDSLKVQNGGIVVTPRISSDRNKVSFDDGTLRITGNSTGVINELHVRLDAGGGTFDIADIFGDLTLEDPVTGTGGLTKTGPGTLILSAANRYVGNTTVNEGTLSLFEGFSNLNPGSIASSPLITVKSGATLLMANLHSGQTLAGDGTVALKDILAGATVAPGESIGTLTVGGEVKFNGVTSELDIEIDLGAPATDLLKVFGPLSLGNASLNVSLHNPIIVSVPQTFIVIEADNGPRNPIIGNFGAINVPARYMATVTKNYVGVDALGRIGDGNDVAITIVSIVPEPGSWLLILMATTATCVSCRIRRHSPHNSR
jgi:autotransporter-associated beta strand protein/T5SS/PEP-CTERM-associated repeat protein